MKRLALVGALVAACGSGTPEPVPQTTKPTTTQQPPAQPDPGIEVRTTNPSPIGEDASKLPLAIVGMRVYFPLDSYVQLPTEESPMTVLLGKDHYTVITLEPKHACFATLIGKIKGVYEATFVYPLEIKDAKLIHGIGVDDLVKCAATVGEKRKKSKLKNPRVAELTLSTFTQLAGPWILWTPDTKGIAEVLASESTTPNPLGLLTKAQPEHPIWYALAMDYTWETFAVPSLGVVFEYDKIYEDGPLMMRFSFADAAAAKLVRERVAKLPDDIALKTAAGEGAIEALAVLRTQAKITVAGSEIIVRGQMKKDDARESPLAVFNVLALPGRRPLTKDEASRVVRPLPN